MNLYKYLSVDIAKYIIANKVIRFTQPIAFNDPYDVYPRLAKILSDEKINELTLKLVSNEQLINKLLDEAIKQELPNLSPELKNIFSIVPIKGFLNTYIEKKYNSHYDLLKKYISPEKFRENLIEKFLFVLSNQIGILSFSKVNNNILMWSHYGNSHKGIVIEFDGGHSFLQQFENGVFQDVIEIEYTNKRPEFIVETFEPTFEESLKMSKKVLFTKAKHWSYEKEFRVIKYLKNALKLEYLDKNGFEIFVYELPKEIIKGIIWGSKTHLKDIEDITSLLYSNGYSNVYFKKAELSSEDFHLNVIAT